MVQRVTYRRKVHYNTRSNIQRKVRTPGGRVVLHHQKKQGTGPKCGDCKSILAGIVRLRPMQYANISITKKTVNRSYGGNLCGKCVRNRILRAFLIEERKIAKDVLKQKEKRKRPAEEKPSQKKTKTDTKLKKPETKTTDKNKKPTSTQKPETTKKTNQTSPI